MYFERGKKNFFFNISTYIELSSGLMLTDEDFWLVIFLSKFVRFRATILLKVVHHCLTLKLYLE